MKNYMGNFALSSCLLLISAVLGMGSFTTLGYAQLQTDGTTTQTINKIIRLTPNESKILHLNKNASSVVVANPVHASVFLDTPRVLVIVPGTPGATSFIILDRDGNEIMQSDVIVSDRKNKYVRIQRVCNGSIDGCVPSSVYYCPDGCHQVFTAAPDAQGSNSSYSGDTASSYMEEEENGEGL